MGLAARQSGEVDINFWRQESVPTPFAAAFAPMLEFPAMNRLPVLSVATFLSAGLLCAQQATEERAVRKVLTDLIEAFNRHDGKAMAKDYAPDLDHINVLGRWTRGKEPMEKLYVREHAPGGMFTGQGNRTQEIQQIKFLKPDVAMAITESKDERNHLRSTYVLTKEESRWLIRSMTVSPIRQGGAATR